MTPYENQTNNPEANLPHLLELISLHGQYFIKKFRANFLGVIPDVISFLQPIVVSNPE